MRPVLADRAARKRIVTLSLSAMDLKRMWKQRRLFVVYLLLLLEMCGGRSGKFTVMARRHRNKGNQWWFVDYYYY